MLATDRITRDDTICGGEPIIRGSRITIRDIVEYMTLYGSPERVLQAMPDLTREDLTAALEYYQSHLEEINLYRREEEESEDWADLPNVFKPNAP